MRLPISAGVSSRDGISDKDPGVYNALKVTTESGEALETRPGMNLVTTSPGTTPQGIVSFDGNLLSVYDSTIYNQDTVVSPVFAKEGVAVNTPDYGTYTITRLQASTLILIAPVFDAIDPAFLAISFQSGEYAGDQLVSIDAWRRLPGIEYFVKSAVTNSAMCIFPVDDGAGGVASSVTSDGQTFTTQAFALAETNWPGMVAFPEYYETYMVAGNGIFVLSAGGKNFWSNNGLDWTQFADSVAMDGLAFANGKFYGTNRNGFPVLYEVTFPATAPEWVQSPDDPLLTTQDYLISSHDDGLVLVTRDASFGQVFYNKSGNASVLLTYDPSKNGPMYANTFSEPDLGTLSFVVDNLQNSSQTDGMRLFTKDSVIWAKDVWQPPHQSYRTVEFFSDSGRSYVITQTNDYDSYPSIAIFPLGEGAARDFGPLSGDFFDFAQSTL